MGKSKSFVLGVLLAMLLYSLSSCGVKKSLVYEEKSKVDTTVKLKGDSLAHTVKTGKDTTFTDPKTGIKVEIKYPKPDSASIKVITPDKEVKIQETKEVKKYQNKGVEKAKARQKRKTERDKLKSEQKSDRDSLKFDAKNQKEKLKHDAKTNKDSLKAAVKINNNETGGGFWNKAKDTLTLIVIIIALIVVTVFWSNIKSILKF